MSTEMEQVLQDLSVAFQQMLTWRPMRHRYPLLFDGAEKQVKALRHRLHLMKKAEKARRDTKVA
ncbi:MAG: hypothetical protein ACYS8W_06250 [Planctomycetota bacterium]|jgi:hypothetical protein